MSGQEQTIRRLLRALAWAGTGRWTETAPTRIQIIIQPSAEGGGKPREERGD